MAKQFTGEVKHVFLKPDEAKFVAIMVAQFITDHKATDRHNWNAEAIKYRSEMLFAATSLKNKLQKLGFNVSDLDPYNDGDEKEFLNP
jgi:ABC-type Zn2+ transport system substrate-binding protein/surface adhesin